MTTLALSAVLVSLLSQQTRVAGAFARHELKLHKRAAIQMLGQYCRGMVSDNGRTVTFANGAILEVSSGRASEYGVCRRVGGNTFVKFSSGLELCSVRIDEVSPTGTWCVASGVRTLNQKSEAITAKVDLKNKRHTVLFGPVIGEQVVVYQDSERRVVDIHWALPRDKSMPKIFATRAAAKRQFENVVEAVRSMPNRESSQLASIDPTGTWALTTRYGVAEIVSPRLKQPKIVSVESNDEWSETENYYWLGSDLLVTDYSPVKKQFRMRLLSTKTFEWSHLADGKLLAYSRNGKHVLIQQGERIQLLSRK